MANIFFKMVISQAADMAHLLLLIGGKVTIGKILKRLLPGFISQFLTCEIGRGFSSAYAGDHGLRPWGLHLRLVVFRVMPVWA
jgi:hypothetical protein